MPDNFENAKDDILYRTEGNGGPTTRDILIAMGALAEDMDEEFKKASQARTEIKEAFEDHCVTSREELEDIQRWRGTVETECFRKVSEALCEEHKKVHAEHLKEMHALGVLDANGEEQSRKVWFMWLIGSKASYIFIALAIFILQMVSNWLWHLLSTPPPP